MKNPYDIIIRPLITEKATKLVDEGKYTFEVKAGVNKIEVKKAIEEVFKVDVVSVNIINVRKKERRVGKYSGYRPAVRKAVVTLQKGQTLDVFEV
ncbi:MAG TPA: 50S ribosomal protein L23 [Acholeplasmataceae bacterium]|jgi:large subunit ribosomal protein L23|nr:50S ribosomal protein L23 [Acholeplasmataceae bacterium]